MKVTHDISWVELLIKTYQDRKISIQTMMHVAAQHKYHITRKSNEKTLETCVLFVGITGPCTGCCCDGQARKLQTVTKDNFRKM
jgi:hypothetical protein